MYHYRRHPAAQTRKVGRVDLGPTAGSSEKRNRPLPPPARVGNFDHTPKGRFSSARPKFEHAPFKRNSTWGILQLSEYVSSLVKKSGEECFGFFFFFCFLILKYPVSELHPMDNQKIILFNCQGSVHQSLSWPPWGGLNL